MMKINWLQLVSDHWLPTWAILPAAINAVATSEGEKYFSHGFFQNSAHTWRKNAHWLRWRWLLTCAWTVWWWRGSPAGPPRTRQASRPRWSWRLPLPPPPRRRRWLWPCSRTCSGWTARRSARPLRCCSPPLWAWPRPPGICLLGVGGNVGSWVTALVPVEFSFFKK